LENVDTVIRYIVGSISYSDPNTTKITIYEIGANIIYSMGIESDNIKDFSNEKLFIYFEKMRDELKYYTNKLKEYCI